MPNIHLPQVFVNKISYHEVVNDKLVTREKTVESKTEPISVDWSGPLITSFTKEALAAKKKLTLYPGQTAEFTDEEAAFLLDRYPFLERADGLGGIKKEVLPPMEEKPTPATEAKASEAYPSNYMEFKKYAVSKGVEVLKTDKKEDILRKLSALKS